MDQSYQLCGTQTLNLYTSQIQTKVMQLIGSTLFNRKFLGYVLGLEHDLGGVSRHTRPN